MNVNKTDRNAESRERIFIVTGGGVEIFDSKRVLTKRAKCRESEEDGKGCSIIIVNEIPYYIVYDLEEKYMNFKMQIDGIDGIDGESIEVAPSGSYKVVDLKKAI